jgi:hypothetical protein
MNTPFGNEKQHALLSSAATGPLRRARGRTPEDAQTQQAKATTAGRHRTPEANPAHKATTNRTIKRRQTTTPAKPEGNPTEHH